MDHLDLNYLKNKYNYLLEDQIKYIKKIGKYILICTNMSFGNNIKGDEFVYNNYINEFPNIKNLIDYDKQKISIFIKLIKIFYKSVI